MEPLGVASSVAVLLSLGIEVSKGLLQYYRSWRFADNDITRTYASIETLAKTLIMVQEVLKKNGFGTENV